MIQSRSYCEYSHWDPVQLVSQKSLNSLCSLCAEIATLPSNRIRVWLISDFQNTESFLNHHNGIVQEQYNLLKSAPRKFISGNFSGTRAGHGDVVNVGNFCQIFPPGFFKEAQDDTDLFKLGPHLFFCCFIRMLQVTLLQQSVKLLLLTRCTTTDCIRQ